MKSLVEFIKESLIVESDETTITFDFNGIENADETVKKLSDMDNVTVDDKKVIVTVTADNYTDLSSVTDVLKSTIKHERDGEKSTNDEQYAQKVSSLEKQLSKLNSSIESFIPKDDNDYKQKKEGDSEE